MLNIGWSLLTLVAVNINPCVVSMQGQAHAIKFLVSEDTVTVELFFAKEHVPSDLKSGSHVHLLAVKGKSVTSTGKTTYMTSVLARNLEVESVTNIEKPKSEEAAVKVVFNVSKEIAIKIVKAKEQLVTVYETSSDGQKKMEKRHLTFRLELMKNNN